MLAAEEAPRRVLRPPRRAEPHLPLPRPRPPRRPRRSSAGARCGGRTASTSPRSTPAPPRCPARTTSPPSRRPTPTTGASAATCSRAGWRREGDVLAFEIEADAFMRHMNRVLVGTMLEVAGGRRTEAGFARLLDGPAARGGGPDGARARALPRRGATDGTLRRPGYPGHVSGRAVRVLLTNDDGIEAEGLQALRRALLDVPDIELAVIAPGLQPLGHRARHHDAPAAVGARRSTSATARSGYATDGTPVDCVRFAALGLVEGFTAELIVSGINHGSNLGDDITYSGTVAAALEGVVLGLPGRRGLPAVRGAGDGLPPRRALRLHRGGRLHRAGGGGDRGRAAAAAGTLLNINVPAGEIDGRRGRPARQAHLPRPALAGGGGVGPQALPHLRRRAGLPPRGRARTSPRSPRAASR